jgi:hypothetical protein
MNWKLGLGMLVFSGVLSAATPVPKVVTRADVDREVEAAFQRSEWTDKERWAFIASTTAHVTDLATSLASPNCVEANPLLGKHPSSATLVATKALAIGFEYWLYSSPRFTEHSKTHWYGFTSAIIHSYIAYSNTQNDCYGR